MFFNIFCLMYSTITAPSVRLSTPWVWDTLHLKLTSYTCRFCKWFERKTLIIHHALLTDDHILPDFQVVLYLNITNSHGNIHFVTKYQTDFISSDAKKTVCAHYTLQFLVKLVNSDWPKSGDWL